MKSLRSLLPLTILSAIFAAFAFAPGAQAGTATGTVINRTTGKPVPNADLDLLAPTQGMKVLASVKSDAQGQFTATNDAIGAGPVLIRVTYQGVSFNTFLSPGRPTVEVEVFEVSKDPKTINAANHVDHLSASRRQTHRRGRIRSSKWLATSGRFLPQRRQF